MRAATTATNMGGMARFGKEYSMTMRGGLFIPAGRPLDKARSSIDAWRRVLDDPNLKVVVAFSLLGLFAALYLAIHFPSQEQIWLEIMTVS
jgi:hypothetical protein